MPVSFFHQLLLSLPSTVMKKVANVAELAVMSELSNRDFRSPRPTWLQLLLSAQCASSRSQHSPQHGTIPWCNQPVTREQMDYIGPIPPGRVRVFVVVVGGGSVIVVCFYLNRYLFWI